MMMMMMMPDMIKSFNSYNKETLHITISLTRNLLFVDHFKHQVSNILAKVHPWFLGSSYSVFHI
jgi:hypothetical protein